LTAPITLGGSSCEVGWEGRLGKPPKLIDIHDRNFFVFLKNTGFDVTPVVVCGQRYENRVIIGFIITPVSDLVYAQVGHFNGKRAWIFGVSHQYTVLKN
jgi:hypothetical protein